jgi:hypothetical protein
MIFCLQKVVHVVGRCPSLLYMMQHVSKEKEKEDAKMNKERKEKS